MTEQERIIEERVKARLKVIVKMQSDDMKKQLEKSEQMWKDKEDLHKIIGYLQGSLKGALIVNDYLLEKLEK